MTSIHWTIAQFVIPLAILLFGGKVYAQIRIDAPDIGENGAVVPLSISFRPTLKKGEQINIRIDNQDAMRVTQEDGELSEISGRFKMNQGTIEVIRLLSGKKIDEGQRKIRIERKSSPQGNPSEITDQSERFGGDGRFLVRLTSSNGFAGNLVYADKNFKTVISGSNLISENAVIGIKGGFSSSIKFSVIKEPRIGLVSNDTNSLVSMASNERPTGNLGVSTSNYVDSSGVEWMRCPLKRNGTPSCTPRDTLITFYDAVHAVTTLGGNWRLPEFDDYRRLASELKTRGSNCGKEVFNELATVLQFRGIFWSSKLYTNTDESNYRTKEVMADAITTDQIPGCSNHFGDYPVYGFNAELAGKTYMAYAVRDLNGKPNSNWNRTVNLIANSSAELVRQNEIEKENEAGRREADSARLGEIIRGSVGQGTSAVRQNDSKTWICQIQCRGPLLKLGSRPKLPSIGSSQWDAAENSKAAADKHCRSEPGITWAEIVRCE